MALAGLAADDLGATLLASVEGGGGTRSKTFAVPIAGGVVPQLLVQQSFTGDEKAAAIALVPDGAHFTIAAVGTRADLKSGFAQGQTGGAALRRQSGNSAQRFFLVPSGASTTAPPYYLSPAQLVVCGDELVTVSTITGQASFPGGIPDPLGVVGTAPAIAYANYDYRDAGLPRTSASTISCNSGTGGVIARSAVALSNSVVCTLLDKNCVGSGSQFTLRVAPAGAALATLLNVGNGTVMVCGQPDGGGVPVGEQIDPLYKATAELIVAGGGPLALLGATSNGWTVRNVVLDGGSSTSRTFPGAVARSMTSAGSNVFVGGGPPSTGNGGFVSHLTLPTLDAVESLAVGASMLDRVELVATAPNGDLWVAGSYSGAITVLGTTFPADAGTFLMRVTR